MYKLLFHDKKGKMMINVNNLSYSFPDKNLYNNITFTLETGDHCAFMGVSGSGKSTLVDLIMNPDRYMYEGDIEISPDLKIGYVSQFLPLDQDKEMTAFEYISSDFVKLQDELTAITTEMETSSDLESLMKKYQEALDEFDAIGGHEFESNITKKLNVANLITHKDLTLSQLSGGEFKLIQVIKEMLNIPDLMIMDEPDVFLDFENLNALKKLINSHKGMLLIITHSRYLLNHCFNKIIHLENMELQEFDGNFIDYNFSRLDNKIEMQELAAADTEEIARNEILINNLRNTATEVDDAGRGRTLKARVKVQERLINRRIKTPFVHLNQPDINLMTDNPIEETTAIRVTDFAVAFDQPLLDKVNFEIKSTDKVAIIGPNGSGKTTLLRAILANNHEAIEINENIEMAYLSQTHSEMLGESNSIMDEFLEAGFKTYQEVISYVAGYGFKEDILDRQIKSLSGGEKNILQLAKVSASKANMLLLDEPTSHLDTYTQIALEKAIKNYNGGIIMVSHDFYSIVNCMDYVLIIEDQTMRKSQMRNFKRMIYARHFDRGYLELEQSKQALEARIEMALKDNDFEKAKILYEDLEKIIESL